MCNKITIFIEQLVQKKLVCFRTFERKSRGQLLRRTSRLCEKHSQDLLSRMWFHVDSILQF